VPNCHDCVQNSYSEQVLSCTVIALHIYQTFHIYRTQLIDKFHGLTSTFENMEENGRDEAVAVFSLVVSIYYSLT
jgi:hypothetical protein